MGLISFIALNKFGMGMCSTISMMSLIIEIVGVTLCTDFLYVIFGKSSSVQDVAYDECWLPYILRSVFGLLRLTAFLIFVKLKFDLRVICVTFFILTAFNIIQIIVTKHFLKHDGSLKEKDFRHKGYISLIIFSILELLNAVSLIMLFLL